MKTSLVWVMLVAAQAGAATPGVVTLATRQSMQGMLVGPLILGAQDPENADLASKTHRALLHERRRLLSDMPITWLPLVGALGGGAFAVAALVGLVGTAALDTLDLVALIASSVVFVGCVIWLVIAIVRRLPMARRLDAVNVQLNLTPDRGDDEYLPPPPPPNVRLEGGPAPLVEVATF